MKREEDKRGIGRYPYDMGVTEWGMDMGEDIDIGLGKKLCWLYLTIGRRTSGLLSSRNCACKYPKLTLPGNFSVGYLMSFLRIIRIMLKVS